MPVLETARRVLKGGSLNPRVKRTICWGTESEAARLGCRGAGTRRWGHAWIRRHMGRLPLASLRVLDAGSGLSNPLLDWYRPRVRHAYLVEFLAAPREEGNTTIIQADLERGIPLDNESVDLVTSCSSIEHLSASGQSLFMAEAQRLLRPGGLAIMTVSYTFRLDAQALTLLSSDPALVRTGCTISAPLNLRCMLAAAPNLFCPEEPKWDSFPGFEGFSERAILDTPEIIFDRVGSYGEVRCLPETDALGLPWAEIAMYLVKR